MSLIQTLQAYEALDSSWASGASVVELIAPYKDCGVEIDVNHVEGATGSTDFVKIVIPGAIGRLSGGTAPTLGIVGRLGGVGARPSRIGLVSDADGAIAAIAAGLKLASMRRLGDVLDGDVVVTTHVCPDAPTMPRRPVDFMGSPIDMAMANRFEVLPEMEAILSIDTTKGNRIINRRGFAISPTVKQGYILKVSEDLLRIMEMTTGTSATTFPITTQDITPYGNGLHHINSIMQPSTDTAAPVVGVAITAETAVPGCATGASHEVDIAATAKFSVEVAKEFGRGTCAFYDVEEFGRLQSLYGSLAHLQGIPFGKATQ